MVHDFKKLAGARKAKLPAFIAPQLATLVKEQKRSERLCGWADVYDEA
jgi:hypothetical protein